MEEEEKHQSESNGGSEYSPRYDPEEGSDISLLHIENLELIRQKYNYK